MAEMLVPQSSISTQFLRFTTQDAALLWGKLSNTLEEVQAHLHQDAIEALNTLQSNFSIVEAIRKSRRELNKQAIPETLEWCRKTGYEVGSSSMAHSSTSLG